jgi:basic membrane protein A
VRAIILPFAALFGLVITIISIPALASQAEIAFPKFGTKREFRPALMYVTGSQDNDRAFIEMARKGAERAQRELSIHFDEYRLPENEDPTEFIRNVAKKGYSPIIAVGYQNVLPVLTLAQEFPQTYFTVIDGLVPPIYQNVQSITFKDHEGAFLVGMIAAYTSKTNHIGFIGGMDVPIIRNFGFGYLQGAKFVRPTINVTLDMVGNTTEAWGKPDIAYDLALRQYNNGADVIFTAAGGSSLGVLRAAKDEDKYAIGIDTNQNSIYPGHVLTSLVKRVDKVIFDSLKQTQMGNWEPGIKMLGLKESALDFSVDENNKEMITQDLIDQVLITRERIINGLIDVEAYSPN